MFSARLLPVASAAAFALTGCGAAADGPSDPRGAVQVVAGFYPLEFVAERVGGPHVEVTNLTRAGAEPHDLELEPREVAALSEADVVVYLSGFQPAVDDAVATAGVEALDVAGVADLAPASEAMPSEEHADEEAHAEESAVDPHFWLDPTRLTDVGEAVAERLAAADPAGAQAYRDGAESLREELTDLDAEFSAGLASCDVAELVTSHTAFGYLAERYGFELLGISGLSPEIEPDARTLAEMAELVRERGITTVYAETLVDPAVAETVADEAGVATAVLDPVEGVTEDSPGDDYVEIMRANLDVLREGQKCT